MRLREKLRPRGRRRKMARTRQSGVREKRRPENATKWRSLTGDASASSDSRLSPVDLVFFSRRCRAARKSNSRGVLVIPVALEPYPRALGTSIAFPSRNGHFGIDMEDGERTIWAGSAS